jgi:hypothetical protein
MHKKLLLILFFNLQSSCFEWPEKIKKIGIGRIVSLLPLPVYPNKNKQLFKAQWALLHNKLVSKETISKKFNFYSRYDCPMLSETGLSGAFEKKYPQFVDMLSDIERDIQLLRNISAQTREDLTLLTRAPEAKDFSHEAQKFLIKNKWRIERLITCHSFFEKKEPLVLLYNLEQEEKKNPAYLFIEAYHENLITPEFLQKNLQSHATPLEEIQTRIHIIQKLINYVKTHWPKPSMRVYYPDPFPGVRDIRNITLHDMLPCYFSKAKKLIEAYQACYDAISIINNE